MYIESQNKNIEMESRIRLLIWIIWSIFLLLVLRLFFLQVVEGSAYQSRAENNRIRLIRTRTPRGTVYDRNGIPLANNRRVFSIFFDPVGTDKNERTKSFNHLVDLLIEHKAVYAEVLGRQANIVEQYRPRKLAEDVDFVTVSAIREQSLDLPGVYVKDEFIRYYPLHNATAHIMGYLRGITVDELQKPQYEEYELDDVVGRNGLEQVYEQQLRGTAGGWMIEVDSRGRKRRDIGNVLAVPGNNIILNIDARLQQKAYELLQGKRGTVVAVDPNTGGVLAMVSEPSYDSNMMSGFLTNLQWAQIMNDQGHPLQNRAVMGMYPPGSIFKLVTALAGLESGKINPNTTFSCPGYFRLGRWTFKCHKKEGHGTLNLNSGISHSCNVYFYRTAQLVGIETLLDYAAQFGIGQPTGIDLLKENNGFLPTRNWKRTYRKEGWYPGDTVQLGIGQGFLLVTPLQMVNMVATIANGGTVYHPFLVRQIEDGSGTIITKTMPTEIRKLNVSKESIGIIQRGMWSVVNGGGTGGLARLPKIEVAGKTGTAQSGTGGADHAWFCGYAPYDHPEIAMLVMVEEGGFGGVAAAPIARELFSTYFESTTPVILPDKEQPIGQQIALGEKGDVLN